MKNYEPNGFGEHIAKVTFQWGKYKYITHGSMGGNCKGFSILESIVDTVVDELMEDGYCTLTMVADNGDECDVDFDNDEDLKDAVVSVEITDWTCQEG